MSSDQPVSEEPSQSPLEFVIRPGISTRVVTLRSGEKVAFAREALDDQVLQVESRFIPLATEHLSYLPPPARIHHAEVVEASDGHAELILHARELRMRGTRDLALHGDLRGEGPDEPSIQFRLASEPRNFEPSSWEDLKKTAPVRLGEVSKWSELPPIIWIISMAVTWGAGEFVKGFISKFGENAADRLPAWLVSAGRKAKDAERHNLVEVNFETADGALVHAFIPFDPHAAEAVAELREGLNRLGSVANFAGFVADGGADDLRLAAFIYDDGKWRLAWWASDDASYIAPWFERNYPDPKLFLGRPLLASNDEEEPRELPTDGATE